jgi:hypothetical protein
MFFDLLNASLNTLRPFIYEHEKNEIDKKNIEKKKILTFFFENLINEKIVFDYKIKADDLFNKFQVFIKDRDFKNEIKIIKTYKQTDTYKQTNTPILALFFENLINQNKAVNIQYRISATILFTKIQAFIKMRKFNNEISLTRVGIDIKEYEGITKMKTYKGIFYCIDVDTIKMYLTTKYNMIFESVEFLDESEA